MLTEVNVIRKAGPPGLNIRGVTCDSRRVGPGDLFVAVKGEKADGLEFLGQAVRAGAAAVAVGAGRFEEARRRLEEASPGAGTPEIGLLEVADERDALARLGRNIHGRPDLDLRVTGITGTNGKTTTAWLLSAMWEAAGVSCGLMGTVEYRMGSHSRPAERTTPEGPEIHDCLRKMHEAGAGACVMEVSSHALDLKRVAGIRFGAAVFTNLTRDHLDYHGDMEGYYAAKRSLFTGLSPDAPAVLNADDPHGRRLAGECAGRPVLYGEAQGAAFRMIRCRTGVDGTVVEIEADGDTEEIRSPLVGRPNAYNLLAAAAASRSMGLGWEAIRSGAEAVQSVPGRLQRVEAGQPFTVVVDYAHTDDALRNVLEVLRPITAGRLIVVFGCGGDRDRSKRPLMGSHAARLADLFWITSDNPRHEDPHAIIEMILEGVRAVPGGDRECQVEPDREAAIRAAVARAHPGDTVLIAGKGHETVQIRGNEKVPFDDVEVARRAITEHREAGPEEAGGESA